MKATKTLRNIRAMIAEEGLRLIEASVSGGCHYRLVIEREDGQRLLYFSSGTSSDFRSDRNMRATFRRFARADFGGSVASPEHRQTTSNRKAQ